MDLLLEFNKNRQITFRSYIYTQKSQSIMVYFGRYILNINVDRVTQLGVIMSRNMGHIFPGNPLLLHTRKEGRLLDVLMLQKNHCAVINECIKWKLE